MVNPIVSVISQVPTAISVIKDGVVQVAELGIRVVMVATNAIDAVYRGKEAKDLIQKKGVSKEQEISQVGGQRSFQVFSKGSKNRNFKLPRAFLKGVESCSFLVSAASGFVYTLYKTNQIALTTIKAASVYSCMLGALGVGYALSLVRGSIRIMRALANLSKIDKNTDPIVHETARKKLIGGLLLTGVGLLGIGVVSGLSFGAPLWLIGVLVSINFTLDFYQNAYDEHRKGRLESEKETPLAAMKEHYKRKLYTFFRKFCCYSKKTTSSLKKGEKKGSLSIKNHSIAKENRKIKKRMQLVKRILGNPKFAEHHGMRSKAEQVEIAILMMEKMKRVRRQQN